jgi:hypothetical protein
MIKSTLMEMVPAYWTKVFGNASLPLQVMILGTLTTAVYFAYLLKPTERHLKDFPIVSLGFDPGSSWSAAGNEIVARGLKEHSGPFQVISGTGPKVCNPKHTYLRRHRHQS